MRVAALFLVLLFALPSAASAGPLSLYGPFDQTHNGERGDVGNHPATYRETFSRCGRGRVRDPSTQECRGPADLR